MVMQTSSEATHVKKKSNYSIFCADNQWVVDNDFYHVAQLANAIQKEPEIEQQSQSSWETWELIEGLIRCCVGEQWWRRFVKIRKQKEETWWWRLIERPNLVARWLSRRERFYPLLSGGLLGLTDHVAVMSHPHQRLIKKFTTLLVSPFGHWRKRSATRTVHKIRSRIIWQGMLHKDFALQNLSLAKFWVDTLIHIFLQSFEFCSASDWHAPQLRFWKNTYLPAIQTLENHFEKSLLRTMQKSQNPQLQLIIHGFILHSFMLSNAK